MNVPFVVHERVRWSDVDAAGIVCYGAYLRFFEIAESELFRAAGLPARTLSDTHGLWLVRRRIECDFLRPALLDDELEVSVHVAKIGRTSLELDFRVMHANHGDPAVSARYALVAVDRESMRPLPIPAPVRSALDPSKRRSDAGG